MSQRMETAIKADGLADIVERVLDKGLVVAGDVAINLVGIELLTIKLRLVLCSVDKARELGIGWWQHDPFLTGVKDQVAEAGQTPELESRLSALEAKLDRLLDQPASLPAPDAIGQPD